MSITVSFTKPDTPSKGSLALGIYSGQKLSPSANLWDGRTNQAISKILRNSRFKGKTAETLVIPSPEGTQLSEIILVGLGETPAEIDFHKAGAAVVKAMNSSQSDEVTIHFDGFTTVEPSEAASFAGAGAMIKAWRFDKYFTRRTMMIDHPLNQSGFIVINPKLQTKLSSLKKPLLKVPTLLVTL